MPKRIGHVTYVHRSNTDALSQEEHAMVGSAKHDVRTDDWNIIKVNKRFRTVSFLKYKDFDTAPHPELVKSFMVDLRVGVSEVRRYSKDNPPILHRKELLVGKDYKHYEKFRRQTQRDEKRGLLGRKDIGTKKGWLKAKREA